jgi:hypothetical protein
VDDAGGGRGGGGNFSELAFRVWKHCMVTLGGHCRDSHDSGLGKTTNSLSPTSTLLPHLPLPRPNILTCRGSRAASRARAARAPPRAPGAPRPTRRRPAGSRPRWRSAPSPAPSAGPKSSCDRATAHTHRPSLEIADHPVTVMKHAPKQSYHEARARQRIDGRWMVRPAGRRPQNRRRLALYSCVRETGDRIGQLKCCLCGSGFGSASEGAGAD